jgi:hypothetical protein
VGLATINADLNTHGSQFSSEVVFSVERQDPVAFSDGCDLFGGKCVFANFRLFGKRFYHFKSFSLILCSDWLK